MNYHPGQKKGDQTDYGEYTLLMLDYLAEHPAPPVPPAGRSWRTRPVQIPPELAPIYRRMRQDNIGCVRIRPDIKFVFEINFCKNCTNFRQQFVEFH